MSTNVSKRELLRKKRLEEKKRKTTTLIVISFIVVAIIGLIILLPNLSTNRSRSGEGRGFVVGDPNAPITVVNFSSFECGFCANFSATTEPDFIANYVETGDVFYRYVNIAQNNESSQNAAKAAYCANDQERAFYFKSYLYSVVSVQDGFSTSNLVDLAAAAGLDRSMFAACMEDNIHKNELSEDLRFARSVGVTGTPSFLVNNQLVFSSELIPLVDSLLNR